MLGTVIGDIIGSVYEFKNHRSKQVTCIVVNRAGHRSMPVKLFKVLAKASSGARLGPLGPVVH